jgi:hypothetical protein
MSIRIFNSRRGWSIVALAGALPAAVAWGGPAFVIRTASATNGLIAPAGPIEVPAGGNAAFTIQPQPGYAVQEVKADGISLGPLRAFAFTNVAADHTLAATFMPDTVNPVPYRETFADRSAGFLAVNTNGWYSDDGDRAVSIRTLTYSYSNALPISRRDQPGGNAIELHSTSLSRYFTWPEDVVWIDLMMNAAHMMRTQVEVDNNARFAFYVSTNAHFMLWHRDPPAAVKRWTEFTDTCIEPDEWIRVAVKIDYKTFERDHYFLQIYLNGVALTNRYGFTTNRRGGDPGGSWFALASTNRPAAAPLTISGNGLFGEMLVNTEHPGFPARAFPLSASAKGTGGRLSYPGVTRVAEGWNKIYRFYPEPGFAVSDIRVDGESCGRADRYVFADVRKPHSLEVEFAPVVAVTWTGPGAIAPTGAVLLKAAERSVFRLTADPGSYLAGLWTADPATSPPLPLAYGPDLTATNLAWTPALPAPGRLHAAFQANQYELVVHSQWGGATVNGAVAPSGYAKMFDGNTELTCAVMNSPLEIGTNRFVCRGWIGAGSVPSNGAGTRAGPFRLLRNSAITWQWTGP